MKRAALTLSITLALLLSAIAGAHFVCLASANPMPDVKGLYAEFSIESPQNKTYDVSPIPLNFTVKTNGWDVNRYQYFFFLDGQGWHASVRVEQIQLIGQTTISDDVSSSGVYFQPYVEYTIWGQGFLPALSDARHNLTIGMCAAFRGQMLGEGSFVEKTVYFRVESSDTGNSDTIIFSEESLPTAWIVAAIAVTAIGAVAFLVYFRRIKKTTGKANQVKEATNNTS